MQRLVIGSLAAAVVMFVLGFVFFGMLFDYGLMPASPTAAMAVKDAMAANLPATGTYMIPADEAAWQAGPGALVKYVAAGGAPDMATAMIGGFIQMFVSALLLGFALTAVGGDFGRQSRVVFWFSLAAAVFICLSNPIWYGSDWKNSIFMFVANGSMLLAGGLVLARWFTSAAVAATPAAAPAE